VKAENVDVWAFDRALEALEDFPAVISATSAKRHLVEAGDMTAVITRRSAPLTLVDMAMPPDFPVAASATLRYLDIDDLARMAERRPRGDEADALVRLAAREAHCSFVDHHQVAPVIGGLTRHADIVVESVVARFGSRLGSDEDRAVLRQTAHTVARRLLAGPIAYIKQPDRAPEAVDVVADAFGVDE
jgi:glutamyl-tRNA reductase